MEDNFSLAYLMVRLAMGFDMLLHGGVRLAGHLDGFREHLAKTFEHTPLPAGLVSLSATLIPCVELLLGLLLLLGVKSREAAVAGFGLMLVLMFGCGLTQSWELVSTQLFYSLVFALLVAFHSHDRRLVLRR